MSTRAEFSRKTKAAAFMRSGGGCERCSAKLFAGNVEYDHQLPCALGGDNSLENCLVLCRACHRTVKTPDDVRRIRKSDRQRDRAIGALTTTRNPLPGSKASGWKHRMNGEWVRR
jgi:5-methylcytosine-specific restriction protein A